MIKMICDDQMKNKYTFLYVIIITLLFVASPAASFADDHGDDALSATAVSIGVEIAGDLELGEDIDWFSFDAVIGERYTIDTTLGTLADTVLYLYSTDGVTPLVFNDDAFGLLASSITWSCPISGTYYIRVEAYAHYQTGTYSLLVSQVDEALEDDHPDSAANATTAAVGSVVNGFMSEYDEDWFSFAATRGVEYIIETELGSLPDSVLYLYDTDGVTELDSNDDNDNGETLASKITWTCELTGVYYVRVTGYFLSDTGGYSLSVTTSSAPDDDHSNEFMTATQVEVGSVTDGSIEYAADEDWYRFSTVTDTQYEITVTLDSLKDSVLELYSTDGVTLIDSSDDLADSTASMLTWTAQDEAYYYIRVTAYSVGDLGDYKLEVSTFSDAPVSAGDSDDSKCFIAAASFGKGREKTSISIIAADMNRLSGLILLN